MKYNIHQKSNTINYVQDLKKLKFSVFWSKIEATLLRQFLEHNSETIERKEE